MKKVLTCMALIVVVMLAGCQLDYQGPKVSTKWIRKGENNGQEWLSRNTGAFAHSVQSTSTETQSMLPMVGN